MLLIIFPVSSFYTSCKNFVLGKNIMDLDKTLVAEISNGILDLSSFRLHKEERRELKKVVAKFLLEKALSQANTIWVNRNLLGLDYETRTTQQ